MNGRKAKQIRRATNLILQNMVAPYVSTPQAMRNHYRRTPHGTVINFGPRALYRQLKRRKPLRAALTRAFPKEVKNIFAAFPQLGEG